MQFPIDVVIGSVHIPSHFVFDCLSLLLGIRYYSYLRDHTDTIKRSSRTSVTLGAIAGALVGAKLLAFADSAGTQIYSELGVSYLLLGGKTIVGALAGGILGAEITKWFMGEKRATGDLFTFPLIYGMIIGRVGCFLTGVSDDTVGLPSALPWALDQGDGILRHPTALYEIIFLGAIWASLALLRRRLTLAPGVLFRLFITAYFFFRVAIDFIKPGTPILFDMTIIQLAALAFGLWYAFDITRCQYKLAHASHQSAVSTA